MSDDDLYIGPTALQPGPSQTGNNIARILFWPLLVILIGTITLLWVVHTVTVVDGDSMEPALYGGERLLVTRGYDEPVGGDVIIFRMGTGEQSGDLVKRVIGLPGDTVSTAGGTVTLNGAPEPQGTYYVDPGDSYATPQVVVPADSLWVMGDNRAVSYDSRYIGPIPQDSVEGRAVAVIWPPARWQLLRRPKQ